MPFDARMALALGKSIKWVHKKISAREMLRWQMINARFPIGDDRSDMRAGMVCEHLRAFNGAETIGLDKYVLGRKPDPPQEVTDENVADLLGLTVG